VLLALNYHVIQSIEILETFRVADFFIGN